MDTLNYGSTTGFKLILMSPNKEKNKMRTLTRDREYRIIVRIIFLLASPHSRRLT